MIVLDNVHDRETVHQRCLLITGRCEGHVGDYGHVEVVTKDQHGRVMFPDQRWPMCHGLFKALAVLVAGDNFLRITSGQNELHSTEICVQYVPLLQTPPLHLAIMVAKDSPLLIDCPPRKFGALSGAHSSLDAAISKLRMTAYMWQALTAEEMRVNGVGRRSFRLEEEWAPDTMSYTFANETTMRSTARVHLIRTEKTVAELRHAKLAQQNPKAGQRDGLHEIFTEALLANGWPFTKEARPVVAGMILDSHYDAKAKLILAHAALGAHDPDGLSLGIFGSHLTYSWPRFVEEIPDCLLDMASPGDRVGNDSGECSSMWEACSIGQGAFLHEVGHAFSAPHTSGIMARGTAYCVHAQTEGITPVTAATPNDCQWDIRDLLRFRNLAHFRQPSDADLGDEPPRFELQDDEEFARVIITSETGIARALFNATVESEPSVGRPSKSIQYTFAEIESRFNAKEPLELEVIAMNGTHRTLNVWKFFEDRDYIRIPGSGIRLTKRSVATDPTQDEYWPWVVMLKKKSQDGSLVSASKIDIRVGCALDGAIIHYDDGTSIPCGLPDKTGHNHGMGGHQSRKIKIPNGVEIVKVAVNKVWNDLRGLRMVLSNGEAMGALNKGYGGAVEVLAPEKGDRIVGFYGTTRRHGMCNQFGILTTSLNQPLPDSIYDEAILQNNPDNRSYPVVESYQQDSDIEDDDSDKSEDKDCGYDTESDADDI